MGTKKRVLLPRRMDGLDDNSDDSNETTRKNNGVGGMVAS